MKRRPGSALATPVKRMLQGTDRISRDTSGRSRSGGTSHDGAHDCLKDAAHRRSSGPSLTGGYAVRPAQAVLRPPPTPTRPAIHFPGSPVIRTPRSGDKIRRSPGRGGPPQFPSPPSMRSAPHTPGSSSRLRLQALHRFHGLRPDFREARHSLARPEGRLSNDAAGFASCCGPHLRSPQRGFRRWAPTWPVSRPSRQPATGPPGSYPDRTSTGRRRRAYEHEETPCTTSRCHLLFCWAHGISSVCISWRGGRASSFPDAAFRENHFLWRISGAGSLRAQRRRPIQIAYVQVLRIGEDRVLLSLRFPCGFLRQFGRQAAQLPHADDIDKDTARGENRDAFYPLLFCPGRGKTAPIFADSNGSADAP